MSTLKTLIKSLFATQSHDALARVKNSFDEFQSSSEAIIQKLRYELQSEHTLFSKEKIAIDGNFFLKKEEVKKSHQDPRQKNTEEQPMEPCVLFNIWNRKQGVFIIGKITFSGMMSFMIHRVTNWKIVNYMACPDPNDSDKADMEMKYKTVFEDVLPGKCAKVTAIENIMCIQPDEEIEASITTLKATLAGATSAQ